MYSGYFANAEQNNTINDGLLQFEYSNSQTSEREKEIERETKINPIIIVKFDNVSELESE